jgi:phospholipid N-methyltransferase
MLSKTRMNLLFARAFFRHPRMLGSIIPSSRFLVRELLQHVDWARARVIVEYGPGIGNVTQEILRRMRADAKLIIIETNHDFVRYLRAYFTDERLAIVAGSAADVAAILQRQGHAKASCIISGIPFSTISQELKEHILLESRAVLEPGGAFVLYQFSSRLLTDLQRIFKNVKRGFELKNVLPAHWFFCTP